MAVNERLLAAGLTVDYDAAAASGDLDRMNTVLARMQLKRDASGMHWSVNDGTTDAQD